MKWQPVGAENSVTLGDLQVFVYEATEPVSSQRPDGRSGVPIGAASGRLLMERSVRTVGVVKSVRGAVPVFRPARFPDRFPNPPCDFHRNGLSVSPRWV